MPEKKLSLKSKEGVVIMYWCTVLTLQSRIPTAYGIELEVLIASSRA